MESAVLETQSHPRARCSSLAMARQVLRTEAAALEYVAERLDDRFDTVVEMLAECLGRVVVSGVGKSADIGRKIAATFNSTGTRSYFLDAASAMHGDLGAVHPDDLALVLSHSGESGEVVRLVASLRHLGAGVVAITSRPQSALGTAADAVLGYGPVQEADPLALAPSTSTTVMLALGDALAFTLAQMRGFTPEDFARFHPGGSLGLRLATVEAHMRQGKALRLARADESVRSVFARAAQGRRRTGAVMLLDSAGRLCGLFTDSDLARLFECRHDDSLDRPIRDVMTSDPLTVRSGSRLSDAVDIMRRHKISELPVVDARGAPVGLLDVTDLLHLMPADDEDAGHAA
jgi:arabinose-5-phosphate isomerase